MKLSTSALLASSIVSANGASLSLLNDLLDIVPILSPGPSSTSTDPNQYVNLFLGADGGGHVFPGPTLPFGMVKMGIDVINSAAGDAYSGYAPDGQVDGISMMHESGTGGAPEYGVVAQLPLTGNVNLAIDNSQPRPDNASIGYYQIFLQNGVEVEFAPTAHAGIYHYTFPADQAANVVVNITHHLRAPSRPYWTQYFTGGNVAVSSDLSQYTGESTFKGGWGEQGDWSIYFCGQFDTPAKSVSSFVGQASSSSLTASSSSQDQAAGVIFTFPDGATDVNSRVGISFLSTDQACANLAAEINHYDVQTTTSQALDAWQSEVFDKVTADTSNSTIATMLYSSLYATHLLPSNRTGENPLWTSSEPYYDDWFTIWDIFRCLTPLYNIMNPDHASGMVRGLIDTYKNNGYMPDARSANQNGRTQGGSNADIVLADAYIKNIGQGEINWNDGYSAMVKDAEVQPPNNNDPFAPDSSTKEGRGALPDWLKYGYITRNYTRSVTRTMEYAMDDFGLSVVAQGLGKTADYQKYLNRSANWRNIWNPEASAKGYSYKGFIQPRNSDGTFNNTNYDPMSCGGCYWGDDEYEGKPVEYGFAVPHDIATLVEYAGGDQTFIKRLDDMFGVYGGAVLGDIGNEPSFLTPFLYNFVNAQYKTVETTRYLINNHFNSGNSGLPGNSDA
ncbi:hypothetical protein AWJ20_2370 [Sugiyamaella lignohabitans]|uniref:Glycoside hydrolase family 92 protein n=1 Tax=Sugiyamaella lignohabitans TaxID=796027 RepID=A0A167F331_9ASCO|nr:uncharacterized protein AWJ20_2370 [Sugiyamaella lignohabitans]ANB14763.1 hypothetical protein AWJ20_2370 [Sugiyamaella lignohabitans]